MNWGSKHRKQITVGGTTKIFYTCSCIELTNTLNKNVFGAQYCSGDSLVTLYNKSDVIGESIP